MTKMNADHALDVAAACEETVSTVVLSEGGDLDDVLYVIGCLYDNVLEAAEDGNAWAQEILSHHHRSIASERKTDSLALWGLMGAVIIFLTVNAVQIVQGC